MRDGRVDVYDSKCRCVKHRHHRHAPSRRCLGGVQGRLYKGFSLAGCCPQTTGQRPYAPSESPRHLCSPSAESVIVGYTL